MRLGEARTPDGTRLYAIGDVHGCDDLLAEAHRKVAADLALRPADDHRIIHIGDYIDRGPDAAAVVDRLARMAEADKHGVFLRGNHEGLLLDFLEDPLGVGPNWLANGGDATLASYGITSSRLFLTGKDCMDFADRLAALVPPSHRAFLSGLDLSARFGDYFFCHAGIRPGVPLDRQRPLDLTWIREEFLLDGRDFGAVVIHGHTPVHEPEALSNRINIDTGAVFGGRLTCLALDGTEHRFL